MIFGIFVFSLTQIPHHRHSVIWSSLLFRAPPHSLANSCIHLHPSTLCATATSPVFCLACHWYHSLIAHMCCQKTKKCCPCCGHKKQLPAVLDPSLLPPTITCSHLRLPFDPSPFPLKSICEVHSMKSYMFCMFTCRAQEALRNSGINGHFGPIPFARVGSRNCDRLMAMLVER